MYLIQLSAEPSITLLPNVSQCLLTLSDLLWSCLVSEPIIIIATRMTFLLTICKLVRTVNVNFVEYIYLKSTIELVSLLMRHTGIKIDWCNVTTLDIPWHPLPSIDLSGVSGYPLTSPPFCLIYTNINYGENCYESSTAISSN